MATMKDKVFPQSKASSGKLDPANSLIRSMAAEEKASRDRKTEKLRALRQSREQPQDTATDSDS